MRTVIYGLVILLFEKSIAFHVNSSISHPNGVEEESYGEPARGIVNTSSLNLTVLEKPKGKSRAPLNSKSWGHTGRKWGCIFHFVGPLKTAFL